MLWDKLYIITPTMAVDVEYLIFKLQHPAPSNMQLWHKKELFDK